MATIHRSSSSKSCGCCLSESAPLTLFTVSLPLYLVCMLLHFSSKTRFTLLNSSLSQVSGLLGKISSPLFSQSSSEDMCSTFITLLTFSYNVRNVHCACCQDPLNELSASTNDKRTKGCIYHWKKQVPSKVCKYFGKILENTIFPKYYKYCNFLFPDEFQD